MWRRDQVSHHILRLAFCNTEEKRRWFLMQETTLFQARLEKEKGTQVTAFLARHGLNFSIVSDDEKARYLPQLRQTLLAVGLGDDASGESGAGADAASLPENQAENLTFYKVPFTQAKDLVRNRLVFLAAGYAYVPKTRVIAIVANRFRAYVSPKQRHWRRKAQDACQQTV